MEFRQDLAGLPAMFRVPEAKTQEAEPQGEAQEAAAQADDENAEEAQTLAEAA